MSAAIVSLYLVHALSLHYVVDDAYISFQYARNFAQGHGLIYNLDERVEGYTNFLWVVILGTIMKIHPGIDPLTLARALSLTAGVGTILLLIRFSCRIHPQGIWSNLLAAGWLACHSSFCAWSMGGLATTWFTFMILLSVYLYDREFRLGASPVPTALVLGMLALIRADGFVVFAILSCARCFELRRRRLPIVSRGSAIWLATFLAVIVPYLAWRIHYYGHPLPNTYYAKVGGGWDQYLRGLRHAKGYLSHYGGALLVPLMLLAFLKRRGEPGLRAGAWLVCGWTAYVIKVGGDGLAFFRFFGCIVPMVYLLAQEGWRNVLTWAHPADDSLSPTRRKCVGAVVVLLLALLSAQQTNETLRHRDRSIAPYHHFDNYFVARCTAAGRWLAQHAPSDAVIASTPAGAIAYYSRRTVIDMLGLTDEHIARTPTAGMGLGRAGHERGDGAYVLRRKPDYILLGNIAVAGTPQSDADMEKLLCQRSEHELWSMPAFHRHYERKTVRLADRGPFQFFTFYERKP